MFSPVRVVPPREYSRCPDCHCFIRLDAGTCSSCGIAFALASCSQRAETRLLEVQCSTLLPSGKFKKLPPPLASDQMNFFQGVL